MADPGPILLPGREPTTDKDETNQQPCRSSRAVPNRGASSYWGSSFWIGESSETLGKAMETMNSSLQMQTDDWLMGGVRNKLVPWLHREWRRAWGARDVMHKAATESFLLVWLHLHLQHPFTRYDEVLQMLHSPFSKSSCPLPLSQEFDMVYPPTLPIFLPGNPLFLSFQQRLGEATCERQSFRAQYRTT